MGNRCRKEYYALGMSLTNNPTICRDYLCRIEETVIIIVNIAKTIIVEIRKFVVYLVVAILITVYLTSIDAEMEMRTSNIPGGTIHVNWSTACYTISNTQIRAGIHVRIKREERFSADIVLQDDRIPV